MKGPKPPRVEGDEFPQFCAVCGRRKERVNLCANCPGPSPLSDPETRRALERLAEQNRRDIVAQLAEDRWTPIVARPVPASRGKGRKR